MLDQQRTRKRVLWPEQQRRPDILEVVAADGNRHVGSDPKRPVEKFVEARVAHVQLVAVGEFDPELGLGLAGLKHTGPVGNVVKETAPGQLTHTRDRLRTPEVSVL